jgi:hypothetical protein
MTRATSRTEIVGTLSLTVGISSKARKILERWLALASTATRNFFYAPKAVARSHLTGPGRFGHPDVSQANRYMNFCERPFAVAIGG